MAGIFTKRGDVDKRYGLERASHEAEGRHQGWGFCKPRNAKDRQESGRDWGKKCGVDLIPQSPVHIFMWLCNLWKLRQAIPVFKPPRTWHFIIAAQSN